MNLDDVVEDVEWLLECREWPPKIAERLGYKQIRSLTRRLTEAGRGDLARLFYGFEKELRLSPRPEPKPRRKRPTPPSARTSERKRRTIAECGTDSGHKRHTRRGEPTCEPCRAAHTAADRDRRRRREQERMAA